MWYLQCHEEPQGSSEDVSDPHPTFTALSPTAFSAPSFVTAPEAPGKPFPLPPILLSQGSCSGCWVVPGEEDVFPAPPWHFLVETGESGSDRL